MLSPTRLKCLKQRKLVRWGGASGALLVLIVLLANHRGCSTTLPGDSAWVRETKSIQKQVEVDGVRIRVLDTGEGTPVLLLHGFLDSSYTWRALIPRLQDRYRVVALDLPGFGYSDKPDETFSLGDYSSVVVGVLDQLGIDRAFIVGNSMGGSVALRIAIDSPERVRGLVPIDPGTPRDEGEPFGPMNLLKMRVVGDLCVHAMGPWVFQRVWNSMLTEGRRISEIEMDEMYGLLNTSGARRAGLRQIREIRSSPVDWEATEKISAPTLLIWGRQDKLVPLKYGRRLNDHIPGSRLVVLDDTGHLPHWETPDEVTRLFDAFVRGIAAAPLDSATFSSRPRRMPPLIGQVR
jgi:pimeloyl-ACP methyl ester carboxylesterase